MVQCLNSVLSCLSQTTASLLHGVLSAQLKPTFHKVNVHAAMTPTDILSCFEPVFKQARMLREAYQHRQDSSSVRVPFVTVSSALH